MPVAPTYPGVYIEEIPSGVHTITGVATAITAFVGYTRRGAVNVATHLFSFADFERALGGVTVDSPLSHCVKHFFQNGGTEAYVVRVAKGADAASVTLKNDPGTGSAVLGITAASEGAWGNNLRIDVDYDTADPEALFNLRVDELIDRNGELVVGRSEVLRNLSMDSAHPAYVLDVIGSVSTLVEATRPTITFSAGTSTSGVLALTDLTPPLAPGYRLAYTLNGRGPFEVRIAAPTPPGTDLTSALAAIASDVQAAITAISPPGITGRTIGGNRLQFTAVTDAEHPAEHSSIRFLDASAASATATLKLGTAHGGSEVDAAAAARPARTGTVGVGTLPTTPDGDLTVEVFRGQTSVKSGITVRVWGTGTSTSTPTSLSALASQLAAALVGAAGTEPLLAGTTVQLSGSTLRIVPDRADPNVSFAFTGATASTLGLSAPGTRNVAAYAPGVGVDALAQTAGLVGKDGTPPGSGELTGSESGKSGIYALEDVDLFNMLVMPDATATAGMPGVLTEAIAYCQRRRAFMLIDLPETVTTFEAAQVWMDTQASPMRSRNAALSFPRLRMPDPLKPNVVSTYPAAGALAGLYARTDAERGVWKAPAGTAAKIVGATGLQYKLTDGENGKLNQLALNCLRTFPVHGTVSWGARTGRGADTLADEYKYVPVRRLALFLEESLYRGTQWVVFEPNDEPLWAQIRLNLGAFMHTLFAQGAFQGRTPQEAYFVKCDKETTTRNDIDLGRVNIVVGFAPLKPAEFVIIQFQQIAGAIQS
ncbi:phage tail sheath family protein [Geodermatophilus sp. URMC 62]|uniref:phage tail sheath family protein n=1 Tax=Geodermatophilus sp. URMC 62 TaxID=3423414 RepID=UPI00406C6893